MPALDFKEIPTASGGAARDQFELFARETLELLGFKIVVGPDRGADAGRDLVVEEVRTGIAGETRLRWLVSCKHKAHSGDSVKPDDELDIHDRVRVHDCQGFLGFYSTVPSAGLAAKLNARSLGFEVQVYDPERIENQLLTPNGRALVKRFFPLSLTKWQREHPTPAKLFREEPELSCAYCKKSLLRPEPHGIVVVWTTIPSKGEAKRTEKVYWCCKGACDRAMHRRVSRDNNIDGWEDIPDLLIPLTYIRWIMTSYNELHKGETYSADAFENTKILLLNLFPLVSRHMTEKEQERIRELGVFPHYLGGWGYED